MIFRLWTVALLMFVSTTSWAINCRPYRAQEAVTNYALPWISGLARLVTAGTCSPSNSFHSSSAIYLHGINDATFAYDFRMRYEPVCLMQGGWMIEFRDTEPDLEGTRLRGRSNFFKILTPQNRVDYYTHLRNSWWTERGEPEYNHLDRREKIFSLKSARGKVKWIRLSDGRYRLVHANGAQISFNDYMTLGASGALDDLYVPRAHCIAYSGSSGTNAPHLHVESRCSLTDSRTCPIEFENADLMEGSRSRGQALGVLKEREVYYAR